MRPTLTTWTVSTASDFVHQAASDSEVGSGGAAADPERGGWPFRRRIPLAAADPAEEPPQEPQLPADPSRSPPDRAWARHADRPVRSRPTRYGVACPGTAAVGSTARGSGRHNRAGVLKPPATGPRVVQCDRLPRFHGNEADKVAGRLARTESLAVHSSPRGPLTGSGPVETGVETGVVAGAVGRCERQALSPLVCSAIAALDPWCSGPTCQPVTLEIAGSNPVGSAIFASTYAPPARPDGAFPCPSRTHAVTSGRIHR